MTFGITPSEPATGYGYIEVGSQLETGAHAIRRFVEKPARDKAEAMLAAGNYVWNSGLFMFQARQVLDEMRSHAPLVVEAAVEAVERAVGRPRLPPS